MAKAIIVAIVVVVVMAVIVSLLNRDDSENFWKLKERDVFHILCFGAAMFCMVLIVSGVWVRMQNVFWASVVRTLPWIVIIVAIWVYMDKRLCGYRDSYDHEDIVYPWDEDDEDEDHVTWPWDE